MADPTTTLRGTVITIDPDRTIYEDGYVKIEDGKIAAVGAASDLPADELPPANSNHVIIPGLVNVHAHIVQNVIRGLAEGVDMSPFERFLGFQFPMSAACDEERSYDSALPTMIELIRSGVTMTQDAHFTHAHKRSIDGVIQAANAVGMRMCASRLIVNDPESTNENMREDVDTGLAEAERVANEWDSDTIMVTAGTIGITYLGMDDLPPIHAWTVERGTPFDIHAPSGGDQRFLAERGWDGGSFEYLDSKGMLTSNLLAGNAQHHVRPGEFDLVAKSGGKVGLVPDVNTIFGTTDFELKEWLDRDVPVGIGLDGQVIAYHQNLWYAMRSIVSVLRVRAEVSDGGIAIPDKPGDAELGLELATLGGARALGVDDRIGSLEVGKEADVVVLDVSDAMHMHPKGALIKNLVWGGPSSSEYVKDVYVRGRRVVHNREIDGVDAPAAAERLDALQRELLTELDLEKLYRPAGRWKLVGAG